MWLITSTICKRTFPCFRVAYYNSIIQCTHVKQPQSKRQCRQTVTMRVFEESTRTAFLAFFGSHIPITLLIDMQAVFGPYYPTGLRSLVTWYSELFGDVLMENAPSTEYAWFSSLVGCEMLFQLPFFFLAVKMIMVRGCNHSEKVNDSSSSAQQHYPEWFRILCIIYGSHVSTTLIPIFTTFVSSPKMTTVQSCASIASKYPSQVRSNAFRMVCCFDACTLIVNLAPSFSTFQSIFPVFYFSFVLVVACCAREFCRHWRQTKARVVPI